MEIQAARTGSAPQPKRGAAPETAAPGPQDQVASGGMPMHNCWDPRQWTKETPAPAETPKLESPAEEADRVKQGAIDPFIAFALHKDFGDAAVTNLKTDDRVNALEGYLTQGWEGPIPDGQQTLNRGADGPWQKAPSPINVYKYVLAGKDKDSDQTITFDSRNGTTSVDSERIRSTVGLADTLRETVERDFQGNVTKPEDTAVAFGIPMG